MAPKDPAVPGHDPREKRHDVRIEYPQQVTFKQQEGLALPVELTIPIAMLRQVMAAILQADAAAAGGVRQAASGGPRIVQ